MRRDQLPVEYLPFSSALREIIVDENLRHILTPSLKRTSVVQRYWHFDENVWKDREDELFEKFLNSDLHTGEDGILQKNKKGDITSLWTDVRDALRKYQLKLCSVNGELLQLRAPHHTTHGYC